MYRENKEMPVTETKHPCLKLWRSRIDWAEQNGGFHADHRQDAGRWTMCAVGEAFKYHGIEYYADADEGPVDKELRRLGWHFLASVQSDHFSLCRQIVAAIEQRLAELAQ